MRVEVAFALREPYVVGVHANELPVASVPQYSTPPSAFTSQLPAERFVTAREVVVALVAVMLVAKKLVEVAFVEVEKLEESAVMDDEALSMMPMVVVGVRLPFTSDQSLNDVFQYSCDEVAKNERVPFHASTLVVENARPAAAKCDAEVVEKKSRFAFQISALVVENDCARYVAPSCPSKVPVQEPVVSKKLVEMEVVAMTEPRELVARRPERTLVTARLVVVACAKSAFAKCEVEEAKMPDCAQSGEVVAALICA